MSELRKARKERLGKALLRRRGAPISERTTAALAEVTGVTRSLALTLLRELEREDLVLGSLAILEGRTQVSWRLL